MKRPAPIDDDDLDVIGHEERPGPDSAGQSGDTQGLSDEEGATSQSVAELVEEGQAWEAGIVARFVQDVSPVDLPSVPEEIVARLLVISAAMEHLPRTSAGWDAQPGLASP